MPKRRTLNLEFPAGGIDKGLSYQRQQPYVTPLALNVRPRESREGRIRGGSRPFLAKYSDTQLGPIAALKQYEWFQLGSGTDTYVWTLTAIGTDLYVGGSFTSIGGLSANRIAKFDTLTSSWSALGVGVNSDVYALAAVGTDLYVGGNFTTAGGSSANYIAKWDTLTSTWSALTTGTNAYVRALAAIGMDLYIGGNFSIAGGITANCIVKFDTLTSTWSSPGSGTNSYVRALAVIGTDLYVGGNFVTAGGSSANYIAKWNGSAWSALTTGANSSVYALAVIGTDLYVGGNFTLAGGIANTVYVAKWNGLAWSALTTGTNAYVLALTTDGTDLYVGGNFVTAGGSPANRIARFVILASTWSALRTGVNGDVYSLVSIGTNVYVGGNFTTAGGLAVGYISGFTPINMPVRMITTANTAATASIQGWSWDWKSGYGDWRHNGVAYFQLQTDYGRAYNSSESGAIGQAGHSIPDDMDTAHPFSIMTPVYSPIGVMGGTTLLGYGREDFSYWGAAGHTYAYMKAERNGATKDHLQISCHKIENGSETVYTYFYSVANDNTAPVVLKMTIDGMDVSYYYNGVLLKMTTVAGSFSGTEIGLLLQGIYSQPWQPNPSFAGCGMVTADYYVTSYVASSSKSIFSAGGNVYVQDSETATPTALAAPLVAGYHDLSPLHPVGAVEMFGKLYIADYSTPRQTASDGEVDSAGVPGLDKFVDGAATNWTTVGTAADDTAIIPNSDVLVISGDTGAGSNNGVYLITAVAAGSLTISPSATTKRASLNYSIMRSPKILDLATNLLSVWKTATPATDGWVPAGCPLIARFAGRIYLAGEANNPHVWYACEMGNPLNWDYSPVATATAAIAGTLSDYAVIALPLTALCPINEDIMLMTAVDEVWRVPPNLRVAGNISNLSQETGCIGANAWTTTPEGRFIFLTRGGIYVVDPTAGQFQSYAAMPFSYRKLPNELKNIKDGDFWISMAYDISDQSIHLYMTPRGGSPGTHWVIDWETRGFVKYVFHGDYQPCVVGPSCAGRLLLGGMDGYLRSYDPDANDDDGVAVTSEVMIGPFPLATPGYEGIVHDIRGILGALSSNVTWELYVGDSAEATYQATAAATGTFVAGRRYSTYPRYRGRAAILKLISTDRWEIESVEVDIEKAGRMRPL